MDLSVASPMRIQDTSPLDGGNYWINGVLQGLARSNLYLHRGGAPTLGSHTRQLLPSTDATEETVRQLHRGGINTWADLLTPQGTLTTEFGKNLALSYQNKEKHRFSKRMWPFGQKH